MSTAFIGRLQKLAASASPNYSGKKFEEVVLDQFIEGMNLKQLQKKFMKQAPENSKAAYKEEILEEQISMISDFEGVNWHGSIDVYERTALVRSTKEMSFLSRRSKCSCCEFSNRHAK